MSQDNNVPSPMMSVGANVPFAIDNSVKTWAQQYNRQHPHIQMPFAEPQAYLTGEFQQNCMYAWAQRNAIVLANASRQNALSGFKHSYGKSRF